jgi:hypothetical protein
MSRMVLLLTSQLRPLSYRLLPCTSSSALSTGRFTYRCQAYLYACRGCLAAYVVPRHCSTEKLIFGAERTISTCPKKRRTQAFSVPKRRPEHAWINTPKLPQTTIFTIIAQAMRRPLVARGVGDLGPAKAESPTLFCSPNLFRYFSLIMLHIKILFKAY